MGQIGSIRFRFGSDSVRVISDFGSTRVVIVLGRFGFGSFNFGFRVEIGSTFFHVGSGSISGHSDRVTFARSTLQCPVSLLRPLSSRLHICSPLLPLFGPSRPPLSSVLSLLESRSVYLDFRHLKVVVPRLFPANRLPESTDISSALPIFRSLEC